MIKTARFAFALALLAASGAAASEISLEITAPAARRTTAAPYRGSYAESLFPGSGVAGTAAALLGRAAAVDIQGRGTPGSQGDISIRGSSFQQTLVLLDGIRLNDPQTAHHNLDLPLPLSGAARVDVLRGPYSAAYGPDAYAGAVNIITARPDRDRAAARLGFGDFGSWSTLASCDRKWNKGGQKLSLEKTYSGGYRPGTGLRSEAVFSRSTLDLPWGELNLTLGYLDKEFGAARFYGTVMNGEREHTRSRFAGLSHKVRAGDWALEPKAYVRRHDDRFSYVYNSAAYANSHATYLSGAELRARRDLGAPGAVTVGGEYAGEKIESGNIGGHGAVRKAVFARYEVSPAPGLDADAALRADRHSSWGWQHSPSLRLAYALAPEAGVWALAGRSFRAPSFTELYYRDPANAGNARLRPEKSVAYEAGADWKPQAGPALRAAFFRRNESDILDWTRPGNSGMWTANNIGRVKVWGAEGALEWAAGPVTASLNYSYVYKDTPARNYVSKYALRYTRQKAGLALKCRVAPESELSLDLSSVERVNEKGYVLTDAGAARRWGPLDAAAAVTNVFNARYEEIPGAPAPGRWLRFSLGYTFN